MRFWVGITDGDWFDTLRGLQPDEVNFWQPSERPPRSMEAGWPFLFKLHAPRNYVVGGGFFVRFTVLPCFLAWAAFGAKNGALSLAEFVERTARYRRAPQTAGTLIGCNVLTAPFFLEDDDWIPVPPDWPRNVQRGFTYDTESPAGEAFWRAIEARIPITASRIEEPRYGEAYLARARLGQGAFRTLVTDAYHRRCAVTGERSLPALEAAHIRPYAAAGPNMTRNGLLLRADVHRLFDEGYVTVDGDLRFVVSSRLREEFENGRDYYALHGRLLENVPEQVADQPALEFIEWHNTEVYIG